MTQKDPDLDRAARAWQSLTWWQRKIFVLRIQWETLPIRWLKWQAGK